MDQTQKQSPTFFYNQNKDPDPDVKGHFFITQIQNLFLAILITALMQLSNHLAIYLIYCCPIYFFIICIQWFVFWKPEDDLTRCFNIFNGIMFVVCVPIFFGVFFAVFHPTASLEFTKVQNCQMIGQLSDWIEHTEKYSILYINFEYEGKQYLGSACASNFYQAKTASPILPYQFYYKYDDIQCGPIDGNDTSPQYHRFLSQSYQNQTKINYNERILRTGGGGGGGGHSSGGGRSGGSRSSSRSGSSSSSSSCHRTYKWSLVKIASWLCLDNDFDIEDYMEPQSCYVNFFTGNKAVLNGILRSEMKQSYNFPLISYQSQAYYPEVDIVCLIIFTYYNWILSFNSLFQYSANFFIKRVRKFKNQVVVPASEQKPNTDPIQLEQMNKEMLNLQPNSNQIDQPQMNSHQNNQIYYIPQNQYMDQPIQHNNQYNISPQMNQVPAYIMGVVPYQNDDNIVKAPQIYNQIQNPMQINQIPTQNLNGVPYQPNLQNQNNNLQTPSAFDNQIQNPIL
ncbi:hypothetical protein ABPG74_022567 [Tetrahymena malaccensis]